MRLGSLTVHFADEEQADALRGEPSLRVVEIGAAIRTQEDLFRELARVLEFPDYFGHNWESVNDCLGDLDADEPLALLVHNATALWNRMAEEMNTFVEVWMDASSVANGELHLVFVQ